VQDKANNMATFRADNQTVSGITLAISGDSCDSGPPQITALSVSPARVSNSEGGTIVITALVQGTWGPEFRPVSIPPWMIDTTSILGARVANDRFVEIGAAVVVLLALRAFLARTRYGLIIRAGVENRAMVTALGIDVRKAFTLVFAIGGVAAALAGVLASVYFQGVEPQRGTSLLIFAFIVVVIGGLGSIEGSAAAAVVVGLTQQYTNYYSSGIGDIAVVLLLALVLLVRPSGLAGKWAVAH